MWFQATEEEVRRLTDEGLACLDAGDADGAIARGRQLVAMRWAGGFELVALGQRMKGDKAGALETLEDAQKVAPGAWMLAQLRGNVLDELGRREDAIAAYDDALAAEGAWRGSIHYNRAVAHAHLGRWGEALADAEAALEDAHGAPFALGAIQLMLDALAALGRHSDAVSLLDHIAAADPRGGVELFDARVGALVRSGASHDAVAEAAERAIEAGVARIEVARFVASRSTGVSEPRARYRVVLRGEAPAGGFFRPASVRAKDEAEALALLAALEPRAGREALAIESIERLRAEEGRAEVLELAGRIFFGDDDEDA